MSRPKAIAPSLRYHISGQSVVTLNGRDFYLGKHNTAESLARYAVLIAEYQAGGLMLSPDFDQEMLHARAKALINLPDAVVSQHQSNQPILVRHVTAAYQEHAKSYYDNDATARGKIAKVCQDLDTLAGDHLAPELGPVLLKQQRDLWVKSGVSRNYANTLTNMVFRIYKWAVSHELVNVESYLKLKTVEPLRKGKTTARENEPVKPVPIEWVRKTAEKLSPTLRAMLRVHVATGMRPSELCNMRPCDIDRSGVEWMYRPPTHKNANLGKSRAIPIVNDAREAITDYMNRDPQSYCFSPAESVAWYNAQKRAARKSKVQPSQRNKRKKNPSMKPGDRYDKDSYRRAIQRAAIEAKVPMWHPYQIRHLNLTEIQDSMSAEHAQAMGGHAHISMTQNYAKASERKAIEAAKNAPKL